jgi:hypothetical protein
MELDLYVDDLTRALAAAGTAGGAEAQQFLDRFATPLASAIRLSMLNVLSAAAEEITAELRSGSVDVRLRGGQPQFVVVPPGPAAEPAVEDEPLPPVPDEGTPARISLRLSERLKVGVDEAAAGEGMSVNTWLVRVIAAALDAEQRRQARRRGLQVGQSYMGWSR